MKRMILSAAVLLLVSTGFANNPPDVNEKILNAFKKTFSEPQDLKWYENETTYEARFSANDVKTIAWYTKEGELLLTHRYYEENKLPPFVSTKIREEFPKYTIKGVAEVSNKSGINYYITLDGDKKWMKIKANTQGDYEIYERFKKCSLPF